MLTAVFAALILQQSAPAQTVVWDTPPEPAPVAAASPPTTPTLPDWALADPFAWERSQCSPLMRREPTMEVCQARVRAELAANLGDALPPALAPSGTPEPCAPTAGDDYAVQCGTPPRAAVAAASPREQVCDTRPQRQPNGGVVWASECRPASGEARKDGLSFRLFGRD